ncbi:MAG: DUF4190 domain-containing protein [Actinoplanes sp.]
MTYPPQPPSQPDPYGNQYGQASGPPAQWPQSPSPQWPHSPSAQWPQSPPAQWPQNPPASPVPYGYVAPMAVAYVPPRPSSGLAVWALVMGIVGVVAGWCLLGLPCLLAVILGHAALADTKSGEKAGRGQAVTGLALGYAALAPAIIVFFWVVLGGMMGIGSAATQ